MCRSDSPPSQSEPHRHTTTHSHRQLHGTNEPVELHKYEGVVQRGELIITPRHDFNIMVAASALGTTEIEHTLWDVSAGVCVCVCVCVCVRVCVYMCMRAHVRVLFLHVHVCAHVCLCLEIEHTHCGLRQVKCPSMWEVVRWQPS